MSGAALPVVIGLLGPGLIGSAFLRQLSQQSQQLLELVNARIEVRGVANSRKMLLSGPDTGSSNSGSSSTSSSTSSSSSYLSWWQEGQDKAEPTDLRRFVDSISASAPPGACCVLVDCTASDAPPEVYQYALSTAKCHIITPNKRMGAGPLTRLNNLKAACKQHCRQFKYEATVGAGLPVISTLQSLIETGDKVLKVEGVLSGSLSYIFNTYRAGLKLSDVVAQAQKLGYTEPDPREDLSGLDVARKAIILARECGLSKELHELLIESVVPAPLSMALVPSATEFMSRLPEFDAEMAEGIAEAEGKREVQRYVATVDVVENSCTVRLRRYPATHAFAQLSGTENLVLFQTERYSEVPLIVRGPGAGAEVTAAGIFSDLISIIRQHSQD